jgi:hypothetical protein
MNWERFFMPVQGTVKTIVPRCWRWLVAGREQPFSIHLQRRGTMPVQVTVKTSAPLWFDYIGYKRLSENKRFPNHRWYSNATWGKLVNGLHSRMTSLVLISVIWHKGGQPNGQISSTQNNSEQRCTVRHSCQVHQSWICGYVHVYKIIKQLFHACSDC